MGTLASELRPLAPRIAEAPRIYADANLPAGVIQWMRHDLQWDVLFVLEHDDLRRAPDASHYRCARELGRTLITLDRDFCDDRKFDPAASPGVIVLVAPDERGIRRLLGDADRTIFRRDPPSPRPLEGRKVILVVSPPSPDSPT
jgi:hypothetical protein